MKTKTTALVMALSAMSLAGLVAPAARADMSPPFVMIMFENANNAPTTGLRYTVTVSDYNVDPGYARFAIKNESTAFDSVLTAVYFHDGVLLGIDTVENPPDGDGLTVNFAPDTHDQSGGISPAVLPGGQNIGFETGNMDGAWAADAENPGPYWGLSNGEYVDIIFTLLPGGTVSDVIAEMWSLDIRVGAHIQQLGVDGEFSGSVVTIPAPGAVVLGVIGLGLVSRVKRCL